MEGSSVVASGHTFGDSVATVVGMLPWWVLCLLGVALVGLLVWWFVYNGHHRQNRRTRWPRYRRIRLHMWPGPGFAGRWILSRDYGLRRALRVAKRRRPDLGWRDRWFGPRSQVSVYHGKAQGWLYLLFRHKVRSSFEDNTLTLAPPQEFKSVSAVPTIWDAPGAAVVSSIRGNLLSDSAGYRATMGEILVFNPAQVGEYGSTFKWNPVEGCRDFNVAIQRAGYMVEAQTSQGLSNADFWSDQTVMYLAPLLHAADLVMGTPEALTEADEGWADALAEPVSMRTITHWISTANTNLMPYEILRQHPGASRSAAEALVRFYKQTPEKTRDSIVVTVGRTLRFMLDETVSEMLIPRPGDATFDAEQFVRSTDTLYMISPPPEGRSPVAPLMAAFLGELFNIGVQANERRRFDRPVSMFLDEVTNTVPVPLASWTSYSAGSGIILHLYSQAVTQFVRRWGSEAADEIVSNCKVQKYSPSLKGESRKLLDTAAGRVRLVRKDKQDTTDRKGGTKTRTVTYESWEDTLPAPGRDIPDAYVFLTVREKMPTIIQLEYFWKSKRYTNYPVENLTLPPVTQRHIPEAIPELVPQILRNAVQQQSTTKAKHIPEKPDGRSPEEAPPLSRRKDSAQALPGEKAANPLDGFLEGFGD
ncbi:type IV secretory system conjugative DNA transfer family protein (plasmid) [Nocardiopsis exhalans]|uniref:Type IV secretory system conjugative DNA transfer family protein n=1 Tax=Nocardiopsis exhalans TaxID=163604 RepID=A0ABY5DGX8_9ACTN|nr:type IV secretory system conjugative DNA transfer family protein [Nocardiopsis exhalans]USY23597.1 type IV secretory system conjugative DNA transfer family protein [Nocardiopsis exhalans]